MSGNERSSRCHGHQQKVIASLDEFDMCPLSSTFRVLDSPRRVQHFSVRMLLIPDVFADSDHVDVTFCSIDKASESYLVVFVERDVVDDKQLVFF